MKRIILASVAVYAVCFLCGCATSVTKLTESSQVQPDIQIYTGKMEEREFKSIPCNLRMNETGTLFGMDFQPIDDGGLKFYAESFEDKAPHDIWIRLSILEGNED